MIKCLVRILVWGAILGLGTACQAGLSNPSQITATMTPQGIPTETPIPTPLFGKEPPINGTPNSIHSTITPEPTSSIEGTTQVLLTSDIAQKARVDLAARLGLKSGEVRVLSVETQELPVQDLGCQEFVPTPTKGGALQSSSPAPVVPGIVIGQVIRLEAGGQFFEYHALGKRLVFCGGLP